MLKIKLKTILILLGIAEFLLILLRWLMTHLTAVSMVTMGTYTASNVGKNYVEKVKMEKILMEKNDSNEINKFKLDSLINAKPILIHDTFRDSIKVKPKIIKLYDTIKINNLLYDTIKAHGQPHLNGDTLKTYIINTNQNVKIHPNYIFTIRNIHNNLGIKILTKIDSTKNQVLK